MCHPLDLFRVNAEFIAGGAIQANSLYPISPAGKDPLWVVIDLFVIITWAPG